MKKIPYGIMDYKKLITEGYEYVDKTMYIEKLENAGDTLMYLRPGRFGKTLFTSMMSYYYDINASSEFETLFKDTYVFNNPTPNKNNYYILKLDFSRIVTANRNEKEMESSFQNCVVLGIERLINNYNFDYEINKEEKVEKLFKSFLNYMYNLKLNNKIYVIIDEYDNFTNAILEGDAKKFLSIVGNAGFVKGFYAALKEYVGLGVVDRVFITGICPVTLDSMTTGFNIATDISRNFEFNSMIGLTHEEVKKLLKGVGDESKENELYDLMIKNYDGYLFSTKTDERVFNATLTMYFLENYTKYNRIPKNLIDNNITVNYGKIDNLLKLQNNTFYKDIIEEILKTDNIKGKIKTKFNLIEDFTRDDIISLLYCFGYLTIQEADILGNIIFKIPNQVMKETYGNYFLKLLKDYNIVFDNEVIMNAQMEIATEGKIDKITYYISEILTHGDNRMFMKYDEKYIQELYFGLLFNNEAFNVYTEYPCNTGYADIYISGKKQELPYDILVELKYIKKNESNKKIIEEKRTEAIEQIKKYAEDTRIDKPNLKKYVVVFVGNEVSLLENVN